MTNQATTTIDSIIAIVNALEIYGGPDLSKFLEQHINNLNTLIHKHNTLAPDWSTAPDEATHYIIHANGKTEWIKAMPDKEIKPIPLASQWSYQYVWWIEPVDQITIPDGIDWRDCCFPRPKARE
jgi:hypothetical protein